jgi:hypothetical protein
VMLGLVRVLQRTGQVERARSYRDDAVHGALTLDDPLLLAEVITSFDRARQWQLSEHGAVDHELVDTVEATLARLPPGDHSLRCRLLATLAFELHGADSERGYQASAEALDMARRLGDPSALRVAIQCRHIQSFRHDGQAERLSLGAELLALADQPVDVQVLGHQILLRANSGIADFDAADRHADKAARIADRYDLPLLANLVGFYRAMRKAVAGDLMAADELYRSAERQSESLAIWRNGANQSVLGRFCLRVMEDQVGKMADELETFYSPPDGSPEIAELYALALASAGRSAEARTVAGAQDPIRRDRFWLIRNGVRGLLAIAVDDRHRGESAYRALLPFAARPTGAETGFLTLWPAAQILGDLAAYLGLPGAQAHYEHALAVAEKANVEPWRAAARCRLN